MKNSVGKRQGPWVAIGLIACAFGCGPDPEIISKQDEHRRVEYERRIQPAPKKFKITPQEEAIRQERLKLEFGDLKAQ